MAFILPNYSILLKASICKMCYTTIFTIGMYVNSCRFLLISLLKVFILENISRKAAAGCYSLIIIFLFTTVCNLCERADILNHLNLIQKVTLSYTCQSLVQNFHYLTQFCKMFTRHPET